MPIDAMPTARPQAAQDIAATSPATLPAALAYPGAPAGALKPPGKPSGNESLVPAGALGQGPLLAGTPRMLTVVRNWGASLAPRIAQTVQQPAAGAPAALTRLLPGLFTPSARVLTAPGLPQYSGSATLAEPQVSVVRAAFTPARRRAFDALQNDAQRAMAASLFAAWIGALQAGTLKASEFDQAIAFSLLEAQRYRAPAVRPEQAQPVQDLALPPAAEAPVAELQLPEVPEAMAGAPLRRHVSSTFDLRTQFEPSPKWSDGQIAEGIDRVARMQGITAPAVLELMNSVLRDPSMSNEERAQALNRTPDSIGRLMARARKALQLGADDNLRSVLAERIGMPFSALAGRIRVDGDPGLTQRVMDSVNPSHREGVAELLLTARPGTGVDTTSYRILDAILRGGDPFVTGHTLSAQLDLPPTKVAAATDFLVRTFGNDRLQMLRTIGFTYEQIISMNPVGHELSRRLDPALGTYSAAERAQRQARNLPNTREEAAQRLLLAQFPASKGMQSLTYRTWVAMGVLSDKPWSMPSDLNHAFLSAVPNGGDTIGADEVSAAFRAAQVLLGKEIPRGTRTDLMSRDYRQSINLLLLQTFGLGASRIGSGALQPIPTDFHISDWPSPTTQPTLVESRAPPTDQGTEEITWPQVLPLLTQRRATVR
jgi:hypothetical protein